MTPSFFTLLCVGYFGLGYILISPFIQSVQFLLSWKIVTYKQFSLSVRLKELTFFIFWPLYFLFLIVAFLSWKK
jgi:hypothetical protein